MYRYGYNYELYFFFTTFLMIFIVFFILYKENYGVTGIVFFYKITYRYKTKVSFSLRPPSKKKKKIYYQIYGRRKPKAGPVLDERNNNNSVFYNYVYVFFIFSL